MKDAKASSQCSDKIRTTVWRLLRFRPRSEKELSTRLKQKKFAKPLIDDTIQYFKSIDLINDEDFAKRWITSRLSKPVGSKRIYFELLEKGICKSVIQKHLEEATANYDQEEIVSNLAKHRIQQYKNIDPLKEKQRIYGYLLRKGFDTNIIQKVIKKLCEPTK